jgi:archaellum biogenesis protein FlaJ (TadC family)
MGEAVESCQSEPGFRPTIQFLLTSVNLQNVAYIVFVASFFFDWFTSFLASTHQADQLLHHKRSFHASDYVHVLRAFQVSTTAPR